VDNLLSACVGAVLAVVGAEVLGYFGRRRQGKMAARAVLNESVTNEVILKEYLEKPDPNIVLSDLVFRSNEHALAGRLNAAEFSTVASAFLGIARCQLILKAGQARELTPSERSWVVRTVSGFTNVTTILRRHGYGMD